LLDRKLPICLHKYSLGPLEFCAMIKSAKRTTSVTTACRASDKYVAITLDNFARDMPSPVGFNYLYEHNGRTYFDIV